MSNSIKEWFNATPWREGIFAMCVRNADRTVLTKSRVSAFPDEALEAALQTLAGLFQNLERSNLNFGRASLVYKQALIHVERRLDGACLVFFTTRDDKAYDADGLDKLFVEFRKL